MDQSKLLALQPETIQAWGPKHKIFLSHSGVQKPFTEHLCEKLEAIQHYAFFDNRLDCLRKGEKFYPPLMKAAQECLVAILVLSDEFFTNSKWSMMELNTFVKAQESINKRLKILPLFFKISRVEFEERKSRQEWMSKWEDFKKHDESIDLHDWMYAVSKISGNNGIEYAGESEGEPEFIKKVVAAVCKLDVPLDVKWDTFHFQSAESLLKPVLKKIKEVGTYDVNKVGLMGLYGTEGVGKTTLTRELCNIMFGEFVGKVCHVELGGMNLKEQMKAVLKDLTSADAAVLDIEHYKLGYLLKERMGRQKVFLVLDNLRDKDIEEVEKYLEAGYHDGSMVLLVSRSLDFLEKRLGVPLHHCMEMPNMDEEGAIDVFLYYAGHSRESIKSIRMWETMKRCVNECYFTKEGRGYAYHPLALKALGTQLKEMIPDEWEKRLKDDKFNFLKDNQRPIFGILRKGYDVLDREEQHIFLDLALLWTNRWRSGSPLRFEWLCTIHRRSEADMKTCVDVFLRKGLLDIEGLDFAVHDLYVEFAEKEAQVGPFEGRRFLLNKHGTEVPHELLEHPRDQCWGSLKRFVMHHSTLRTLKRANLKNCKNVEVLDLDSCEELEELDVTGMSNLRCIVVTRFEKLERLVGFDELSDLVILRFERCPKLLNLDVGIFELEELQFFDVSGCESLTSLVGIACAPALQELKAQNCRSLMELPDDFSGLKQLQSLNVSGCGSLTSLVGIARAPALQEVKAQWCLSLMELPDDFSELKQLQSLDVSGCESLTSLVGIARAPALQEVKAQWCSSLMELPDDFSGLKQLQSLDVRNCEILTSLGGIACAEALQELKASGCSELRELPDDFSGLKQLQSLDVRNCESLTSLGGIACAEALQELKASGCSGLKELPNDFSGLKKLKSLDVRKYRNLTSVGGIVGAEALQDLKDQSHGADMPVDVDNVEFQVGTDDMGIEDAVDVDDDAQECKDELSAVADFQDIQAANAVGVPSSSAIVLEDQTHELEMPVDVDKVEFQVEKDVTEAVSRPPVVLHENTIIGQMVRPNLIRDELQIDLTKDLLGVSSTGYVIRTSCSGMQGQAQPCALKRIDVMNTNGTNLARLDHLHIVQLIDHWVEEKFLFLIMELMDGDLAKLMARTKKPRASPFTLHVTVDLMLQIALGMRYLHEMGVSHPHLKCENVLYRVAKAEAYQVGDRNVLVKLGGFGWSRPADVRSKNRDLVCFGQTCLEILTGNANSKMVNKSSILETTPAALKNCIVGCLDTQTTFEDVVEELLRAKLYIVQCCKDETICSSEVIQTQIVSTKTDDILDEIFTVHQLHPEAGDASTSIRATLVFFHGFHKVPEEWRRTWMTRDNKLVWPQKWLPEDLGSQSIRVLSVSFDANSNVSNKYNRHEMGKNLVERLILSPRWKLGEIGEAVFLIGHSFGGVLIKSFVTEAQSNAQERDKCLKFLDNLVEVVFYSVPHAALTPVEFEDYISVCRKVVPLQRSSFLKSLREDTEFIADMCKLSVDFERALPENVKVLAFLEGKPMSMRGVLVTEKSFEGLSRSWECHKVDKDNHFEVSRPESKSHIGYKILLDHLLPYMV